ncbi:MAG TPA: hypothetical protein VLZ78_08020 [Terrimesophilobacter sp.]|nr:hypothetical protein [Terrimesophilobacter sp.]
MSDESTPDPDVPVGDMTEEGETEIGPHPSLTHLEDLDQAGLEAAAKEIQEDPDANT